MDHAIVHGSRNPARKTIRYPFNLYRDRFYEGQIALSTIDQGRKKEFSSMGAQPGEKISCRPTEYIFVLNLHVHKHIVV